MARDKTARQKAEEAIKKRTTPGKYRIEHNLTLKLSINRRVIERTYFFRKKKRSKAHNPKIADSSTRLTKVQECRDSMAKAVNQGRCPINAQGQFFSEAVTANKKTFGDLAAQLMENQKTNQMMAAKTWMDYLGTLRNHVLPA